MSKTGKIWLITAAVFVALGLILFAGVMATCDWDFTALGTVTYVTNTYKANEAFDKIAINVDTAEIVFVPAEDDACRIVFFEAENAGHSVTVQNRTLIINTVDTREWYAHIGISLETPKMTVYLPQNEYDSLLIDTDTGDITIPKEFSFGILEIDGDTADVDCFASASGAIEIELSTGHINVDGVKADRLDLATTTGTVKVNAVTVGSDIDIETDTGRTELNGVTCGELTADSDTGKILLEDVIATGSFSIRSDTGDIRFEHSDAAQIFVKTDTGDVVGSLLTGKIFITESDTGKVVVPPSDTTGGRCEIVVDTGDIRIDIP